MGMLGRSDSSGEDQPLTTQWLRAAVTPERVAAMRGMTLEEVVAHLKQLTMRMCMLLVGGADKAHLFNGSLEAVVNEYGEFGMLLHVAADRVNHRIGACCRHVAALLLYDRFSTASVVLNTATNTQAACNAWPSTT
jgi:hypothetical protein